jgi:cytoskeletal protein CcmA (bactofilin family)
MKNPFKRTGFDTLIGEGMSIVGNMLLPEGSTTVVDGLVEGEFIAADDNTGRTTLQIAGTVKMAQKVIVSNVTVTGVLECDELVVKGVLSVQSGAKVIARLIRYKLLNVEPSAVLNGTMESMSEPADAKVVPIKAVQ